MVTFIKMDNSAGRSFFLRSGVGRIRHISVRVLWMQQRVKEKGLIPSRVPSRENPADQGTKRLAKDRMEYLMCLCKVYNMDTLEFVGMNAYDKIQEQDNMKASIGNKDIAPPNNFSESSFSPWVLRKWLWHFLPVQFQLTPAQLQASWTTRM